MLSKSIFAVLIPAFSLNIHIPNALGEEAGSLALNLEVGVEYDNNITVDALDLTSQQGDTAALFDGAVSYDFLNKEDSHFKAGYSFSQSLYFDLSEFDLQTHGATLEAGTRIQEVDLGISYNFYHISLGSESFLQMHMVRPSFNLLLGQKTLLIGSYEYLKQNFQQPALLIRNSDRHSIDLKAYFLLGKGRTINAGYKISRNDAMTDPLDYWGHIFDLGFKLPVTAIEGSKFTMRYRYNQKNYTHITPGIGENRKDKRHALRAALEIPVAEKFSAFLQYEYTDSNSNLQSLIYSNHLISIRIGWEI